jgi:hypothetical protein
MSKDTTAIPAQPLYGDPNKTLRADLQRAGARFKYDSTQQVGLWHVPTDVLPSFLDRLPEGCKVGITASLPIVEEVTPPPPVLKLPEPAFPEVQTRPTVLTSGDDFEIPSLPMPAQPEVPKPSGPPVVVPPTLPTPAPPVEAQKPAEVPAQQEPEQDSTPKGGSNGPKPPAKAPAGRQVDGENLMPLDGEKMLLVIQQVSNPGDVAYMRLDTQHEQRTDAEGTESAITTRTSRKIVKNPKEEQAAKQLAGKLRQPIRKLGRVLITGVVLVPKAEEEQVKALIEKGRKQCTTFNSKAKHHFLRYDTYILPVESDDAQIAKALAYEVQRMMDSLVEALDECNVSKIRNVAAQIKTFEKALPDAQSEMLGSAVINARGMASSMRDLIREKKKDIDTVRKMVDTSSVVQIRAQFLEYAAPEEMAEARSSVEAARFADMSTGSDDAATGFGFDEDAK